MGRPDRVSGRGKPPPAGAGAAAPQRGLRALWNTAVGVLGTVVGLAPHVLHHVGLLVGAAFIAGAAGTVLFGVVGLVASIPFLLRLRRRFASWWAPLIGLAVFVVMFSFSAFVLGPAISSRQDPAPKDAQPSPSSDHTGHHS